MAELNDFYFGIEMFTGTSAATANFRLLFTVACLVVSGNVSGQEALSETLSQPESSQEQASGSNLELNLSDNAAPSNDTQQSPAANVSPAANANQAEASPNSANPDAGQEPPEGYQEELDRRIKLFQDLRLELEASITKQRQIYIRYVNREQHGPQFRRSYFDQRIVTRVMMTKVYDAALDILRIGIDKEAVTYMITMLQHRHGIGQYDYQTMEGAARLIDGGSNLQYLFEVAARSAVVCGQFEMAKKLYEALPDEDQKDIDKRLEYTIDALGKEYDIEEKLRLAELEADNLPQVKLRTTQGVIVVELFIDQAPSTVSHFIQLVEDGFYDGKDFFQVIEDLLALAGDPDATMDPNAKFLVDEHQLPNARSGLRGSLVMAKVPREGKDLEERFFANSATSQFAILLTPLVNAQGDQTVFGTVIEGMEVVSRLARVDPHKKKKKGEQQIPADSIIEATVVRRPDQLPAPVFVQE